MVCSPLQATQVKSVIETKANEIHPGGKPPAKGYVECYEDILESNAKHFTGSLQVQTFRKQIKDGMGIENFLIAIRGLYPQLSEKANHKMRGVVPQLPEYRQAEEFEKILECVAISAEPYYIKAIQLVLKPYDLLPESLFQSGRYPLL